MVIKSVKFHTPQGICSAHIYPFPHLISSFLLPEILSRLKTSVSLFFKSSRYFYFETKISFSLAETGGFLSVVKIFFDSLKSAAGISKIRNEWDSRPIFFVYFRVIEFIRQILSPFDWTQISLSRNADSRVTVEFPTILSRLWRLSSLSRKAWSVYLIEAMRRKPQSLAQRRAKPPDLGNKSMSDSLYIPTDKTLHECKSAIYNLQKTGAILRNQIYSKTQLGDLARISRSFQHTQIVFSVIYGSSIFIFPRRVCNSKPTHSLTGGIFVPEGEQLSAFTWQLMDYLLII